MFEGLGNSRDMATTWKLEKMDSVGPRFMLKKEVIVWHHMTLKYGLLHTWQLAEA
jgi:hypothetical protein